MLFVRLRGVRGCAVSDERRSIFSDFSMPERLEPWNDYFNDDDF